MNRIYHSSHSAMPSWLTVAESVNIINQQSGLSISENDIWKYALYGHLTLSIYFQSPVKMRRVKITKNNIVLIKTHDDAISQLLVPVLGAFFS
ncbi:hypothetical protein CDR68_21730 [Salmonella enterica]|nr:hypothetical protein [Salmonella enterica]